MFRRCIFPYICITMYLLFGCGKSEPVNNFTVRDNAFEGSSENRSDEFPNEQESMKSREEEYQKIMTKKLGLYIKENYAGKKAVVIIDPYLNVENPPNLEGLKAGLGNDVEITEIIKPKTLESTDSKKPGTLIPQEKWFTVKEFNNLLAGKDFDICITLIGLPADTQMIDKDLNIEALKGKKVFIGGGSIYNLKQAIVDSAITAAVFYKTDPIYDDKPIPSNLDEAFDKRYALITKDNIEQHKTLFR